MSEKHNVLVVEYNRLEKRHKKLVSEGREIKKENEENLKYYIDKHVSDHEWEGYLEKAASEYAIASVRMNIAETKMDDVRKTLKLDC